MRLLRTSNRFFFWTRCALCDQQFKLTDPMPQLVLASGQKLDLCDQCEAECEESGLKAEGLPSAISVGWDTLTK